MLKNLFLKTLRDYRRFTLIWGGLLAVLMLAVMAAYTSLFSGGPAERLRQLVDLQKLVEQFSFLTGSAPDLDTFGGYASYQVSRVLPILVPILLLTVGSALIRGEEDKGYLDLLLSTPHSRASVFLQKWAAMVVVTGVIAALIVVGMLAGAPLSGQSLDGFRALLALLNLALLALFFGSLALFFGQLVGTRLAAAGWAGGLLATTFILNNLAGLSPDLDWLKYFSPYYYYNQSKPLAPSYGTNWPALFILAGASLGVTALALVMYQARDQGDVFRLLGRERARERNGAVSYSRPRSPWLANSFMFGLRGALVGALIWGAGISAWFFIIMSTFNRIRGDFLSFLQGSEIYKTFGLATLFSNENLLHILVFATSSFLVAGYAITLVVGWQSEESEGHLELVLSTPEPRWRFLVSRFAVAALGAALLYFVTGLALAFASGLNNVAVKLGNLAGAFFGLWVLTVIIAAAGWLLVALIPGRAISVLTGLVVLSYLSELLANLFKLPGWVVSFSILHQYGQPIVTGLDWPPQLIMLALSALFLAGAVLRFERRDILQ